MKAIFTILLLAALSYAQVPDIPNLGNYKEIARDELIVYFVNAKDINRLNPRFIVVSTMGVHYVLDDDGEKYKLNNAAYIVTTWRIDCKERTGQRLKDVGVWQEKPVNKVYKKPKIEKPTKSRNLWIAIDAVCGDTSPELTDKDSKIETVSKEPSRAGEADTLLGWSQFPLPYNLKESAASKGNKSAIWIGGNGCNLIGGGKAEAECCTAHDYAYRQGGNLGTKWVADKQLFKCIWKRNKFLAPFAWVGANVGGLFAFHWGKKRDLSGGPVRRSARSKILQ